MTHIIEFKVKKESRFHVDGSLAYEFIKIPKIKNHHLNKNALRNRNDRLGIFANSDLIVQICQSIINKESKNNIIKLGQVNDCFEIETGYLLTVKFYHNESKS
jgi:hypothetical protein